MFAKAGTFQKSGTTGLQQVAHGLGETPQVLLLWNAGSETLDTPENHGLGLAFGMAVGSTSRACCLAHSALGENPSNTARRHTNAAVFTKLSVAGAVDNEADLDSLDSTNFTLDWVINSGDGDRLSYLVLAGLEDASIVEFQRATALGNQAITGAGFAPDAVIVVTAHMLTPPSTTSTAMFSLGFGGGPTERGCVGFASADNVSPTNVACALRSDLIVAVPASSAAYLTEADLVSLDADGCTLDWDTILAGGQVSCWALFLKGVRAKVGVETQKTSTGTKATTGVGSKPHALMLLGAMKTAALNDDQAFTLGAASGADAQTVQAVFELDNQAAASLSAQLSDGNIITHLNATETILAEAALQSLDADGYTLNWTTADATAREFLFLALTVLRVVAEAGSVAVTGTAAALLAAKKVAAAAGALAVTGTASTLRATRTLAASAGAFAVTGTAASVRAAHKVVAAAGAFAVTGTAAAVLFRRALAAVAGAVAITGTAAVLRAARQIVAAAGAVSITGVAAALRFVRLLSAAVGSFVITGVGVVFRGGIPGLVTISDARAGAVTATLSRVGSVTLSDGQP